MDEVTICYGMTETSPVSTQTAPRRPARAARRHRRPGASARRGQDRRPGRPGAIVPRGEPGELCTRGYSVMLGYWDDPERDRARRSTRRAGCTPATWRRWTTTATSTSSGGSRTWSSAAARTSTRARSRSSSTPTRTIADVQVIGVPDERYGEELWPGSCCATGAALDEDELREFCRGRIAHYKIPRYVHVRRRVPDDRHRQGAEVQDARARDRGARPRGGRDRLRRTVSGARLVRFTRAARRRGRTRNRSR